MSEKILLDALDRVAKNSLGYTVLYVNISKLKPKNRHPEFVKIFAKLFDSMVGNAQGSFFVMSNGDFAILACRELQPQSLIGTDISEGMMNIAREKVRQAGLADRISFAREDCTALSFAESSFDAVTVAFGIRNFEHLDLGLHEMCRVLRPGGHLVILELSTPDRFPMKQLFFLYSKIIMPLIGKLISKDNSAYTYLPESIRAFPQGEVMQKAIRNAGFSEVHFKRLTFGICTLYVATK